MPPNQDVTASTMLPHDVVLLNRHQLTFIIMKKGGGSESTIIVGPSNSVLVYALYSLEYVQGLARFRMKFTKWNFGGGNIMVWEHFHYLAAYHCSWYRLGRKAPITWARWKVVSYHFWMKMAMNDILFSKTMLESLSAEKKKLTSNTFIHHNQPRIDPINQHGTVPLVK